MSTQHDEQPDIDFDLLQKRYEAERQKRLRADSLNQYRQLTGAFAAFGKDPNADPDFRRDPVNRLADVLIVGGGFAGLLAGAFLHRQGVTDIVFVDRAGDFGGTWYWNRYPGVRCDVESYVYVPLLEETGFMPSEKYAKGAEIFGQCQRIARLYGFYDKALFQTDAQELRWDGNRDRWIVRTNRGDEIAARFVVSCTGLLSSPKLPDIPGIESFAGHSCHTSRWDYAFTGGNADGGMTGLADKVVGVIGTGSTGIQCIPPLAESAKHLYVFQRTPCSIDVRGNRPTDPQWAATLEPGWQQKRVENFTFWTSGMRVGEDMIADSWTNLLSEPAAVTGGAGEVVDPVAMQKAEILKMEKVRQRIEATVSDPATAEALKPYYNYFCKRPGFSDDYLETYNRPNVTLVDTGGKGVERITPGGVVVDGCEYEVDFLVFATGFDFMTEYTREAGFSIFGRDGISLDEHWSHGARTLFGMQTHGFPNFFIMSLVQSGIGINYLHIAEAQTRHIAHVIGHCMANGIVSVEPTQAAESEWVERIVAGAGPRRAFLEACTPSYFNYEGSKQERLETNEPFPGGAIEYLRILDEWQADGSLPGLELRRQATTGPA